MNIWIAGSPEEVVQAAQTGLVSAVVTNPTVIAAWTQSGESLEDVATSVIKATNLPLYVQLHGPGRDQFLREADYLKNISGQIIPKIPACLLYTSRQFKKVQGLSPLEYQKTQRAKLASPRQR